jgi:hypothetical protein
MIKTFKIIIYSKYYLALVIIVYQKNRPLFCVTLQISEPINPAFKGGAD